MATKRILIIVMNSRTRGRMGEQHNSILNESGERGGCMYDGVDQITAFKTVDGIKTTEMLIEDAEVLVKQ
jgi:hypothetical protein